MLGYTGHEWFPFILDLEAILVKQLFLTSFPNRKITYSPTPPKSHDVYFFGGKEISGIHPVQPTPSHHHRIFPVFSKTKPSDFPSKQPTNHSNNPNHHRVCKVTILPDQIMEGIVVDTNRSIGKGCHKTSDWMIWIHLLTHSGDKKIGTLGNEKKGSVCNPKQPFFNGWKWWFPTICQL